MKSDKTSDLKAEEQAHVRTALNFLRARCGGWTALGKVLRFKARTVARVSAGKSVSATMAFRIARIAGTPVDDVLTGKFPPPGTCPHCGHCKEAA